MENFSSDLIKTFRQIIYRDLYYVISGYAIVLYAKYYISPRELLGLGQDNLIGYISLFGWCLAIGLINQEVWSQSGLITTTINRGEYRKIWIGMYERHTKKKWTKLNTELKIPIVNEWEKELWTRMIDLKQIGSSLSSCNLTLCLISAYGALKYETGILYPIFHLFSAFMFGDCILDKCRLSA